MGRREDIDTGIWSDPDFMDLSPVAKSVYLWSFTNQRIGMAGIYRVGRRAIELETGWIGDDLDAALTELEETRFAFYDGRVMFVRSRVKHLRTTSPSIAKSIEKDMAAVNGHPFADLWRAENRHLDWLFAAHRIPDTPLTPPPGGPDTPSTPPAGGAEGVQGTGKGKEGGPGETTPPADALPDDLPPERHALAAAVHERLARVAIAKRGARRPTLAAVGRVIADYPDHDHERIVGEFEHYWVHGDGAGTIRKDIALTYRRRLERLAPTARPQQPSGPRAGESLSDFAARMNAAHAA